ncbi:MAG TPA: nitroreductase family protein [Acidimicrobiales bacterium]|jgi:nitroreductase|nr:nitroreductase family protein [Acidimicrobiales bacterium]
MEFDEVLRRRAMVRSFASDEVAAPVIDRMVAAALRSPTAGNTGGTAWVVLSGVAETAVYWDATTDDAWRARSPRWEGLCRAPVVLLAYASAASYVARYAEPDKSDTVLGSTELNWPVPYWTGDAAFGVMTLLLAAVDAGLGACVLGNFRGEAALAAALGVPPEWRLFCAVLVGHADGDDHPSPSLARTVPDMSERIHRGSW